MKFSQNWLQQWLDFPIDSAKLAQQLTMAGHEVEQVQPVANSFTNVVIGEVIEVQPHPKADRLSLCQLRTADHVYQVVCGADNVRVGLKVAFALVGACLGADFEIKRTQVRDQLSEGMICSEQELGLTESATGIMELPQDAPLGLNVRDYLQLDDQSLDIDLTPNRGDCLSIRGLAREVAALNQARWLDIKQSIISMETDKRVTVNVAAPSACPRYLGRVIDNIDPRCPSPIWLQERLRRSGLRSISVIVDITNYVMLELGQPLHAFDYDQLDRQVHVRWAQPEERLTLLTEDAVELQQNDLVIADDSGPLALAGIMGGHRSSCTLQTQTVFLESAFFSAQAIAGRARTHGLHTDSSHRFERGVDPNLQRLAIERATQLLLEIVGGQAGPIIEQVDAQYLPSPRTIAFQPAKISRLLGIDIANQTIQDLLLYLNLYMQQNPHESRWQVQVPAYRFDINQEVDLVEEVARLHGYDQVPLHYPQSPLKTTSSNRETDIDIEQVRTTLVEQGYQEIYSYSFVDEQLQQLLNPNQPAKALSNPIAHDMNVMRTHLWPGLINAILQNQHHQQLRVRLFEIGQCYQQHQQTLTQPTMVAGAVTGTAYPEQWGMTSRPVDFYDIKGDVEKLCQLTRQSQRFQWQSSRYPALHPGQTACLMDQQQQRNVGWVGALHPKILRQLKCKGPIFLFEIEHEVLTHTTLPHYQPFSKYPAIRRDLAFLIPKEVPAYQINKEATEAAGGLLIDCWIFDIYQGKGVPEQYKSVALALTLQHQQRTLVDKEVEQVVNQVILALTKQLQASLRE